MYVNVYHVVCMCVHYKEVRIYIRIFAVHEGAVCLSNVRTYVRAAHLYDDMCSCVGIRK